MFNVILRKIESMHQNMPDEVIGICDELPTLGESFHMHGDPAQNLPGYIQLIATTPVKALLQPTNPHTVLFRTQNSLYELTVDFEAGHA